MPQIQNDQMVDILRPYFAPNDVLEIWEWLTTFHFGLVQNVTDHFRGSALLSQWAWAGAPFAVPAGISLADDSLLEITNLSGSRSFLQQATITGDDLYASVALVALTVGTAVGLRIDDGTDNNYAEVVLYLSQASPTQWIVQSRYRVGGGGVATANGDAMDAPLPYVLRMQFTDTQWTAWGFYPVLHTPFGLRGIMWKPNTDLAAGGAAWTPTRAGLVFDNSAGGGAWEGGTVDWVNL